MPFDVFGSPIYNFVAHGGLADRTQEPVGPSSSWRDRQRRRTASFVAAQEFAHTVAENLLGLVTNLRLGRVKFSRLTDCIKQSAAECKTRNRSEAGASNQSFPRVFQRPI